MKTIFDGLIVIDEGRFRLPKYVGELRIAGLIVELTEEQWPSEKHRLAQEETFGFKYIRYEEQ